jgi:galactonate dehydratase
MRIVCIEALPFRAPREASHTGTAGAPAQLRQTEAPYLWAATYPVIYSKYFETALVRVELDNGMTGWGEAQAPVAPEVACAVINHILSPVFTGAAFDGTVAEIENLWWRMYSTMRVRGQTSGFMLDGIAGVDLALWDLAGQIAGLPVSELIGVAKSKVPAYLSGIEGSDPESARPWVERGFDTVKVFHDADTDLLRRNFDALRKFVPFVAVDALWRLTSASARELAPCLSGALWLEAPLQPESALDHGGLAASIDIPLAIGESYRTTFELAPFFAARAMHFVQPDLGRTGITEGLRIAAEAGRRSIAVVPHVSIAMGPQLAAAIHFAAAVPNCKLLEFNPNVLQVVNRYLDEAIELEGAAYNVPQRPGLGITLRAL